MDPEGKGTNSVERVGGGGGGEDPRQVAARVVRDLRWLVRRFLIREGLGSGERSPEEAVPLTVSVRTDPGPVPVEGDTESLIREVQRAVREVVRTSWAFRIGRVYCLQCGTSDCAHAGPTSDTMVFAGYGPSGKPRFVEISHLLLERGDARSALLFGERPKVVALRMDAREIHRDLLVDPPPDCPVRILGQVCVGPLVRPGPIGREAEERFVLSLQVMETRTPAGKARLRLNLLGADGDVLSGWAGTGGRETEERVRRLVRRLQGRIDDLGRRNARERRRRSGEDLEAAVAALLERVRLEMERAWSGDRNRTRHALRRHVDGGRPTALALADAREAPAERLRWDEDRRTVVVLGPRGRTHVFTMDGRHVTSIVRDPGEERRKATRQRWRLLTTDEAGRFRQAVAADRGGSP